MAHQLFFRSALLFFFSTAASCWAGDEEALRWQKKMKALAETMGELLPELFAEAGDRKKIEKGAKALSELSQELHKGHRSGKLAPPADADPSLPFLADQFASQTRRAYAAIQRGNNDYGKNILRGVTTYCAACHTRHEGGPDLAAFPLSDKVNQLGRQEKSDLYVATRQFDKALVELKDLIAKRDRSKTSLLEWERSVRSALAIAVRVKQDPALASEIVTLALREEQLPEFEQVRLRKWQKAVGAWKQEPVRKSATADEYAATMRRLRTEATKAQLYPLDRSAEVQYLRITAAAHDILRLSQDRKLLAEALLNAGLAYEVLFQPLLWTMHEFYFEACIRRLPHSALAQECYERFEESVYVGYSGTAGTNIPADAEVLLAELQRLAEPKAEPKAKAPPPKQEKK